MQAPQPNPQIRDRLLALIHDDHLDGGALLSRLRSLRRIEKASTCAALLQLLTHLTLTEADAERLLGDVLDHRERLTARLKRDPGLQVAALDFLTNFRRLLSNPTVVEFDELERTRISAFTDPLTHLYNRRFFQSSLDREVRRSSRYGLEMSLLMLDLDGFKPVNDLYGHLSGDRVIERTGGIIRRMIRDSDVACRFGGEEFAVILPETGRIGAYAVAERIRAEVERHFSRTPVENRIVLMTLSGGVACFPADGADPEILLSRSDQALYQAKTRGKNRIITYHSERRRAVRFPARRGARAEIAGKQGEGRARPLNLSESGAGGGGRNTPP